MDFFIFTRQYVGARKIRRISGVLRARALPTGIGRAVCPGLITVFYTIKVSPPSLIYDAKLTGILNDQFLEE